MCCLVTVSEDETEFKRGSSDRKKCVTLTLEFNINSNEDYDC